MKVLVTGADGQLGQDVTQLLRFADISCQGTLRKDFDITDEKAVQGFIETYRPDVVVHCAAYTAVDEAEENQDTCFNTNVLGTRHIAKACTDIGAKLLYISTDYVFEGSGEKPFETTDTPHPINYYGLTKYLGELEVQRLMEKYFIVRISWVFGAHGNNFVKTMLRLGKEKSEIRVVSDQIGSPTCTADAAKLICDMIKTEKYGIYHATNEGFCSWYEFAMEIFSAADMDVNVTPIASRDYLTKANRPRNSRLSKQKLDAAGFERLPAYQTAIQRFVRQYKDIL